MFQDVLEFLKEESETKVGCEALWEAGEILAMYSPAGMTSFFFSDFEKLQGNARQVGIPTENGVRFYFRPVGMLVINQSSGHQKEISEFLEALLSVQSQTRDRLVMSVRKDAAEYGIVRHENISRTELRTENNGYIVCHKILIDVNILGHGMLEGMF